MNQKSSRARWISGAAVVGAVAVVAASTSVPATAGPDRDDRASARHAKNGTVRGVYDHLIRFEAIGDARRGTRASGTPGYKVSVRYVARQLRRAGYKPQRQAFDFPFFVQQGPSTFEQTAPAPATYTEDEDFVLMTYSGSGDLTGAIQGVDLALADPATSTSGCEPADFSGFTAGNIALIQRGGCSFGDKAANATAAGAAGVIVFNQGDDPADPSRTDAFAGTLGGPVEGAGPVVGTSFAIGEELATAPGAEVRLAADTASDIRRTWNVIAQTKAGRRKNVVMAGAHLDSVPEGAGIQDNGSGSAALLEVAEALADQKRKPRNQVRFAWWGAEEFGLLGSEHYVADMVENSPRKFNNIALYLNFDMVASPNYMLGVYDGNNNSFPPEESADAPKGSAAIERTFHRYFDRIGTGSVDTAFSGRSDYGPFIAENVPAGGLFTGAEGQKSAEEAAMFGGAAGQPYDACYHLACDDLGNVNRKALKYNTGAIWNAVKKYARSTRSVNGKRSGHRPPPPEARTARQAQGHDVHGHDAHGHDAARR